MVKVTVDINRKEMVGMINEYAKILDGIEAKSQKVIQKLSMEKGDQDE